jgi:hypothetical protein
MSLLIAAVTVNGFSFTVKTNLLHPAKPRPLLLWIHGAAFSAWVVLFIAQSALIRTRKVRLHRSLGMLGAALGAVMVPLGIAISIIMGRFHIHQLHEAASGYEAPLISPFYDMAAFAILLSLAIYSRRRPDLRGFADPARRVPRPHRRPPCAQGLSLRSARFGSRPEPDDVRRSERLGMVGEDRARDFGLGALRDTTSGSSFETPANLAHLN